MLYLNGPTYDLGFMPHRKSRMQFFQSPLQLQAVRLGIGPNLIEGNCAVSSERDLPEVKVAEKVFVLPRSSERAFLQKRRR
jgi:hypothetical protein